MEKKKSERMVRTQAKDLCTYILTVTQKSPKQFRYTFVSRLQNLSLNVIEYLIRANDIYIQAGDPRSYEKRQALQRQAMTEVKILGYLAMLSAEQKCILPKQFQQIAMGCGTVQKLIGAWMLSDQRRLQS